MKLSPQPTPLELLAFAERFQPDCVITGARIMTVTFHDDWHVELGITGEKGCWFDYNRDEWSMGVTNITSTFRMFPRRQLPDHQQRTLGQWRDKDTFLVVFGLQDPRMVLVMDPVTGEMVGMRRDPKTAATP